MSFLLLPNLQRQSTEGITYTKPQHYYLLHTANWLVKCVQGITINTTAHTILQQEESDLGLGAQFSKLPEMTLG